MSHQCAAVGQGDGGDLQIIGTDGRAEAFKPAGCMESDDRMCLLHAAADGVRFVGPAVPDGDAAPSGTAGPTNETASLSSWISRADSRASVNTSSHAQGSASRFAASVL